MKKLKSLLMLLVATLAITACSNNQGTANQTDRTTTSGSDDTYKIGVIRYMDHVSLDQATQGFIDKLKEDGVKVEIIDKSANGDMSLINTIAQSMVSDKVDMIYAVSTPSAQAAANVTKDIPIVFSAVTDPVGAGLVEAFDKKTTNVTGVSDYVDPKNQIEEFLKIYPDVKSFGVLYNTSEQNSVVQIEELEKILKEKGIKLESTGINTINDIPLAISSLSGKVDALFALTDNMVANAAPTVAKELIDLKIPSLSSEEGQVKQGLLISEGVDYYKHGAQAAELAKKVIDGTKIQDVPVEYNKTSSKTVNKKTAEALGLDLNDKAFENANFVE
ncbi:MAG: ABC transporter substrate-binding protein [Finegoldia sp.]|nr:ABC transporter substrate-binding protein [Finegoldia sp.]